MLADEGEAGPELDQELVDMLQEPLLEWAFLGLFSQL
jgi:hypothetical protein